MSQATCVNCGTYLQFREEEFCQDCHEKIDKMVDAKNFLEPNVVDIEDNYNPFFGQGKVTGNIRSESTQSLEGKRYRDDSPTVYILGLMSIVFVMVYMVYYFI